MMSEVTPDPTEQEWRDLYHAADSFKQLEPWEWMLDSDIFGVQNPETGEIGYCCVMGNLGEHFALALYLGNDGLRGYLRMQAGEFEPPSLGALYVQHCLMASFEDRELLSKRDRDRIKALGLKYRGRKAWPLFNNYTPGYVPWSLTGAEARFLTLALQQACEVAQRFDEDEAVLDPPVAGQLLLRSMENGAWRDSWHMPDLTDEAGPPPGPVDDELLRRLKQAGLPSGGAWESDCFYTPHGAQDQPDQRPYYPMMCLFVDGTTGMVLPPILAHPENWRAEYQNQLPMLIAQAGVIPREIAVPSRELGDLLAPAAELLGIRLRLARWLPAVDEARNSLMEFLEGR